MVTCSKYWAALMAAYDPSMDLILERGGDPWWDTGWIGGYLPVDMCRSVMANMGCGDGYRFAHGDGSGTPYPNGAVACPNLEHGCGHGDGDGDCEHGW